MFELKNENSLMNKMSTRNLNNEMKILSQVKASYIFLVSLFVKKNTFSISLLPLILQIGYLYIDWFGKYDIKMAISTQVHINVDYNDINEFLIIKYLLNDVQTNYNDVVNFMW